MPVQQRGKETQDRILDIAAARFAQNGYSATSIAEICEHAGVSKGAFYYHFTSKQAIFLALLDRWMNELESAFNNATQGPEPMPVKLTNMAKMMRTILQDEHAQVAMFLEFWTQASRDNAVWQATIAPYRKFQTYFAALIEQGIEEGSLAPIDPEAGAQVIISLASGLLLQGLLDPDGADWGQVSQASIRILLDGLERPRSAS
jgi:AcrR family transcriptional regulator